MKTLLLALFLALPVVAFAAKPLPPPVPQSEINALAKETLEVVKSLKGEVADGKKNTESLQKGIDAQAETIRLQAEKIESLKGKFFSGLFVGAVFIGGPLFLSGLALGSGILRRRTPAPVVVEEFPVEPEPTPEEIAAAKALLAKAKKAPRK